MPSRPGQSPSRPGELHHEPLTEPYVNLSIHTARATQRRLPPPTRSLSSSGCALALDLDAGDPLPSLDEHYLLSWRLCQTGFYSGPERLDLDREGAAMQQMAERLEKFAKPKTKSMFRCSAI